MKKKQKFPRGWNEAKVREVIAHYENQSEDEEFAEIEAAYRRAASEQLGDRLTGRKDGDGPAEPVG